MPRHGEAGLAGAPAALFGAAAGFGAVVALCEDWLGAERVTLCDWRPNEPPPPMRRASASDITSVIVVTISIKVISIFFMPSPKV
jgi:hypothetical protein